MHLSLAENCTSHCLLFTFPGVIFTQILVITDCAIPPLRNNFLNRGVLDECNITPVFSHALERSVVARVLVHACWCRALGTTSSLAQRAKFGNKFWFLYVALYTCLQKKANVANISYYEQHITRKLNLHFYFYYLHHGGHFNYKWFPVSRKNQEDYFTSYNNI